MQGKATVAGHPIHPILVTFPIGCFVAAVVCDIVSIWAGVAFWAAMSTALIGFGIAGTLIAGFFGFVDYLSAPMSAAAKSVGAWHLTVMVCVAIVFGVAFALRVGAHATPAGYVLTVAGAVLLVVGGTLGGSLAHRHLVGSAESDRREPRNANDEAALTPEERIVRSREINRRV